MAASLPPTQHRDEPILLRLPRLNLFPPLEAAPVAAPVEPVAPGRPVETVVATPAAVAVQHPTPVAPTRVPPTSVAPTSAAPATPVANHDGLLQRVRRDRALGTALLVFGLVAMVILAVALESANQGYNLG